MNPPADGEAAPGRTHPDPADAAPEPAFAPNWQRTLFVMLGIQLGMNLGFTVLSPVMPLFLPQLGVRDPTAIDLWAGALAAITPLVAAFASPIWGRVADRRGRKLMVLRSCFSISVFIGLMSLVTNVWQFAALRALMGVFAGFNAATISLVASQVPPGRLGYSLGWLSTGQLVGALIGPLLGGFVADLTGSYRAPFVFTSAVCVLCGVLCADPGARTLHPAQGQRPQGEPVPKLRHPLPLARACCRSSSCCCSPSSASRRCSRS